MPLKYGNYARDTSVPDYEEEDDYYPGEPAHIADPEVDIGHKRVAKDVVDNDVVDTKEKEVNKPESGDTPDIVNKFDKYLNDLNMVNKEEMCAPL